MNIDDLKKKTVLILGAGKTGIASAFFLLDKANKILLSESQDLIKDNEGKINQLIKSGAKVEFGKNSDDFIKKADIIIISPGISPQTEIVKKINALNIPIISDIELASYFIKKPIIAITGTNGKTTTTSLIAHIINNSGRKAISCGNIGKPLIEATNETQVDYYVLEISSFQIFYSPTLACDIAICLNITPDHLDWHETFENYLEAKKKLFFQQKSNSWAILNYDDDNLKQFKTNNNVFYFSYNLKDKKTIDSFQNVSFFENNKLKVRHNNITKEIIDKNKLRTLGAHNIENCLASIACAKILDCPDKTLHSALEKFEGVEHRLEYVRKTRGKEFYNDSKATNPEATIKAIKAFEGKKITLILGGRDKKTSLDEMVHTIKNHVNEVILFGEARDRFYQNLNNNNYKEIKIVSNLNEAISMSLSSKTEIVLFSPACSSFDMFKNYEERGKQFKEFVSRVSTN